MQFLTTHFVEGIEGYEEYVPVAYSYGYSVAHARTNDFKSHRETRIGDNVKGTYQVLDPDGFQRIVNYKADKSGFNAKVLRIPFHKNY